MYVARSVLDLGQQVRRLIDIIRYAEHAVHALGPASGLHGEVICQASLFIPLHMRSRCRSLHVQYCALKCFQVHTLRQIHAEGVLAEMPEAKHTAAKTQPRPTVPGMLPGSSQ